MNQRIFPTEEELMRGTARAMVEAIAGKERAAVGLSGGSTPRPLYQLLASPPFRERLAAVSVTWVVVDERYVPIDDPQSNAGMMKETLFADGMLPSHRFLRFRTELGDPQETARVFEQEWEEILGERRLDLILLGVGDDGHTASLFPGTEVVEVRDRRAAAVFVPRLDQWRVTMTLPVIRDAQMRFVQVKGAAKRPIIEQVRSGEPHPITLATQGVESWWFLDEQAAGT